VPFRIDIIDPPADALDRLMSLEALDLEVVPRGIAALLPDSITAAQIEDLFGRVHVSISPAAPRDDGSVWVLRQRTVHTGRLVIAAADQPASAGVLRLVDSPAFGTGLHPTTALCLDALSREVAGTLPARLLDIGTGSGILALAALVMGVPSAVALDIDPSALQSARANARLNSLADRLHLLRGGPEALHGAWPLVVANILAAPLIEAAPAVVRCVAHRGRLMLSGISVGMAPEVARAYEHLGMRPIQSEVRDGWSCLLLAASW
jgi:ribosomal protein L11 methyltransferase